MAVRFLLKGAIVLFLSSASSAYCQVVDQDDVYQVSVSLGKSGSKTRLISCVDGVPGRVKTRGDTIRFRSYQKIVRSLKQNGQAGTRKFRTNRQLLRRGKTACDLSSQSVFDDDGNTTTAGRLTLNIPSGITGNISRGAAIADPYCTQCHAEKTNRTYSILESRLPAAPMFLEYTEQEVADIAAYLNRNR